MGVLRLFLALSVVIWHLPARSANLVDAGVAVLMFFIISGFYMALVINETSGWAFLRRYGATISSPARSASSSRAASPITSTHLYARIKTRPAARSIGVAVGGAIALFALGSIWRDGGVLMIDRARGYDTVPLRLAYVALALSLPFLFAASKSNPLDRWIGELSYPLYLVHGLTIGLVFGKPHRPAGDVAWEAGVVLLSVTLPDRLASAGDGRV
jgi:peptidoglycan/LPS O-acetylase OafA/YrhL